MFEKQIVEFIENYINGRNHQQKKNQLNQRQSTKQSNHRDGGAGKERGGIRNRDYFFIITIAYYKKSYRFKYTFDQPIYVFMNF